MSCQPYVLTIAPGPNSRILPVGHFSIILEDCLTGLTIEFMQHMQLKDIVEYLFAEIVTGVLENPKSYILHSWTIQYLLIAGFKYDVVTTDKEIYEYVYDKLKLSLDAVVPAMRNYLTIAMRSTETRDFVLVRWFQETNIIVTISKEHDPFAF